MGDGEARREFRNNEGHTCKVSLHTFHVAKWLFSCGLNQPVKKVRLSKDILFCLPRLMRPCVWRSAVPLMVSQCLVSISLIWSDDSTMAYHDHHDSLLFDYHLVARDCIFMSWRSLFFVLAFCALGRHGIWGSSAYVCMLLYLECGHNSSFLKRKMMCVD